MITLETWIGNKDSDPVLLGDVEASPLLLRDRQHDCAYLIEVLLTRGGFALQVATPSGKWITISPDGKIEVDNIDN
jgi:hypothetical protein